MILNYVSLSKVLVVVLVSFVFLKIYQHNLVIKVNYERQRLEKKKAHLEKVKNDCCVQLWTLLEPEKLVAMARDEWGMKTIKVNQVKAVPKQAGIEFLGTTSHNDVLKKIGLYDMVMGITGR